MQLKTFIALLVLALLLGAGAWWTLRQQASPAPALVGNLVWPALPINEVRKIQIQTPGTNIIISKTESIWQVASRFNYPAKFEKVVETLQDLSNLKIGQVIHAGEAQLEQFHLLPPDAEGPPEQTGTLLQLFNAQDQILASLLIGKPFLRQPTGGQESGSLWGGYPDGQYIRRATGPVLLVAQSLQRLVEPAKYWLDDEFINVPAQDIMEISISGPGRQPLTLQRERVTDTLQLVKNDGEAGPVDNAKLQQLASSLHYLGFDDVLEPTETATGLQQPTLIQARTKQGQTYTLSLGQTVDHESFDRYLQVSVAYTPPANAAAESKEDAPTDAAAQQALAEQTQKLNAQLSPWIYVLKSYRAEALLIQRAELFQDTEPPPDEPAADLSYQTDRAPVHS